MWNNMTVTCFLVKLMLQRPGVGAYSLEGQSFGDPNLMKMMSGDSLRIKKTLKIPLLTVQEWNNAVRMRQTHMNLPKITKQFGCLQATFSKMRRYFDHTEEWQSQARKGNRTLYVSQAHNFNKRKVIYPQQKKKKKILPVRQKYLDRQINSSCPVQNCLVCQR